MGVVHDFQFAPAHAHLNLLGWASMALFGLSYHANPQLANSRIAVAHFACSPALAPSTSRRDRALDRRCHGGCCDRRGVHLAWRGRSVLGEPGPDHVLAGPLACSDARRVIGRALSSFSRGTLLRTAALGPIAAVYLPLRSNHNRQQSGRAAARFWTEWTGHVGDDGR